MLIASLIARASKDFECVPDTATLAEAIDLMDGLAIGSVGVVSSPSTAFRGLLSQSDVIAALANHGERALGQIVSRFTQPDVLACHGEDDVGKVMLAMTRHRCRHAVVKTPTGAIVGLVSLGDLVAVMLDEARLETGVLRDMARSRILNAGF